MAALLDWDRRRYSSQRMLPREGEEKGRGKRIKAKGEEEEDGQGVAEREEEKVQWLQWFIWRPTLLKTNN
jgi:hypothetical protein